MLRAVIIPHLRPNSRLGQTRFCTWTPASWRIEKPMRPSILIADDHRLYAEALGAILSPGYKTVAIATNGRQLTSLAVQFKPDVIVTDHAMPVLNGLRALRTLVRIGLPSKFIVLTTNREVSFAVEAFRSGASAFLLKTGSSDEFWSFPVVLDGGYYLSTQFPSDLGAVLADHCQPTHRNPV